MPRFYLHLVNGSGFAEDLEGKHYPDLEAARAAASEGLRDILSAELRRGELHTGSFVEIEDEHHALVATLLFEDVVKTTTRVPPIPSRVRT